MIESNWMQIIAAKIRCKRMEGEGERGVQLAENKLIDRHIWCFVAAYQYNFGDEYRALA